MMLFLFGLLECFPYGRAITDETIGRVIQFCFDRAKDVVGKQQTQYIAAAPGSRRAPQGCFLLLLFLKVGY